MARRAPVRYLIAGGGPAGTFAAQEIRKGDPEGAILIAAREPGTLYNRTLLSKAFLLGAEARRLVLKEPGFYARRRIELAEGTVVEAVDLRSRVARLSDGSAQPFERLLVATGSDAVRPALSGASGSGVCILRTLRDAAEIRERAGEAERAVCVGGGFIGIETACALRELGLDVDLIMLEPRVWPALLPEPLAAPLEVRLVEGGVRVLPGRALAGFELEGGALTGLRLAGGQRLPARLAVLGLGARPAVGFLAGSGLPLARGVLVGPTLESPVAGVFAAGDAAEVEDRAGASRRLVGHWTNAVEQGRVAGGNLAGRRPTLRHLEPPLFDTRVFDLEVAFVGEPSSALPFVVHGSLEERRFIAFFFEAERLKGSLHVNRTEATLAARALIREGRRVDARALADLGLAEAQAPA